tara:strand:- start:1816 stop:2307 length:492 start_codon:yes stop_codon:yes gene_type:complete
LTKIHVLFANGPLWDTQRTVKPGGGLFSTADDMRKLYQMMLNGGIWNGSRLLSEDSGYGLTRTQACEIETGFTAWTSWKLKFQAVKEPQGVTEMMNPGTLGHGGAYTTQSWADPVNQTIYILIAQRRGWRNGDKSPWRRAFQNAPRDPQRKSKVCSACSLHLS